MWWNEIVRVSPSAVAFCSVSEPRKTRRAAMLQQYPALAGRRDNNFVRALLTGTCPPTINCASSPARGERRGRQTPFFAAAGAEANMANALLIRDGLTPS